MLLGIDDETFGKVTDFEPYLTNEIKKEKFSFELEQSGYTKFHNAGWNYRREKYWQQQNLEKLQREYQSLYDQEAKRVMLDQASSGYSPDGRLIQADSPAPATATAPKAKFAPLPKVAPDIDELYKDKTDNQEDSNDRFAAVKPDGTVELAPFDPHMDLRKKLTAEEMFNPCLLYTSPSPRDRQKSRMPSSA